MSTSQKSLKPFNWVIISVIGFVVFMAMAILFSIYSNRLNLISSSTYFFLLIPLGLLAAAFLFGAMRSHAKYSGKAYNGTLQLSGPIVVLALIIILGYKFRPTENTFSTTVNVFSSDTNQTPVDEGKLAIYYGTAHVSKKINDGQVVLHELPQTFRGKQITVIPTAEGYASKAISVVVPANENVINLYLQKLEDSVTMRGIVLTEKGKPVKDAVIVFADGMAKTSTDDFGNFQLSVPLKDGTETTVRVYKNDELKYNHLVRVSAQAPLSIQLNN